MLPIQSVLYEMLPRRNVTIRKCTIRNVTDPINLPFDHLSSLQICWSDRFSRYDVYCIQSDRQPIKVYI